MTQKINLPEKVKSPEEKELNRFLDEQKSLEEKVISAEIDLETLNVELNQFKQRYFKSVGTLYAELDDVEAKIARLKAHMHKSDAAAQAKADAAESRARKTAEEVGFLKKQNIKTKGILTPELKETYRTAAKMMHPDLATTEQERKRRTALMTRINLAYQSGDIEQIRKIMTEFGQDPEAIIGEDIGSKLVKTIRRIAQLRSRLEDLKDKIETLKHVEVYQLKIRIENEETDGMDPLNDLAKTIESDISKKKAELNALKSMKS